MTDPKKTSYINMIFAKLYPAKKESSLNKQNHKTDLHQTQQEKIEFYQKKYAYLDENPAWMAFFLKVYYGFILKKAAFKLKYFEVYDFFKSGFIALFFAMLIRSFLFQPFNIPSESMLPTLVVGDFIFVNKYAYGFSRYSLPFAPPLFKGRIFQSDPKRGDVAVFRVIDDNNKDYIKRIVGLPGDKIQYINGRLWVNNVAVPAKFMGHYDKNPVDPQAKGATIIQEELNGKTYNTLDIFSNNIVDNTPIYTVPKGHYFVSGDNRDKSQDSRAMYGPVGFVPQDRLIGRAEVIFFSLKDSYFIEFWKWPQAIRFERIFTKIE